jgi:hypothetical protein
MIINYERLKSFELYLIPVTKKAAVNAAAMYTDGFSSAGNKPPSPFYGDPSMHEVPCM